MTLNQDYLNSIKSELEKLPIKHKKRRTHVPFRPTNNVNYLNMMKNCIGKELSKVSLPVDFNEPLSTLQRLTEDLEYSYLLDKAVSEKHDPYKRLAYISAFALSAYSSLPNRNAKPFNPLLGETFEFDRREDRGFFSVAEQISHHPPTSALFAVGEGWAVQEKYTFSTAVKGKTFTVHQDGSTFIKFTDTDSTYVYKKLPCSRVITNLVSGKVTTSCVGEIVIFQNKCAAQSRIKLVENKNGSHNAISGTIVDENGRIRYQLHGVWDKHILLRKLDEDGDIVAETLVWQRFPLPENSEKMHGFSQFAIELNELEEGVAPTDSRFRPDQRYMENGDWKKANHVKTELESRQRLRKAKRDELGKTYTPLWFLPKPESRRLTADDQIEFNLDYLVHHRTKDWKICPKIFEF
ncbi:unnamed protein product [Bursaphelenchus xylophilus]|uniref:Oxysterol-binding protein n=1 Tax=Bursaphelenchus xylophilus TaxID=6326 RepID=A0A1I7S5U2_BURXY|nr:unnamed protein product [Bursaphelenchus xylophilus]CAG9125065.1 unnamed protein product [Bursaphelenchus xylophilus]